MDTQKKLFAFKLAEKQAKNADENDGKWKARDGLAIAACTRKNGNPLDGWWIRGLTNPDQFPSCI